MKFKVGDRVLHKPLEVLGIVIEVDKTETWFPYKIEAQDSSLWAAKDDLELVQEKEKI